MCSLQNVLLIKCALQRMYFLFNVFSIECVLYRMCSIQNVGSRTTLTWLAWIHSIDAYCISYYLVRDPAFYREHILQKTHSIEKWIQSIDAYYMSQRVTPNSIENTFEREHILQKTHSIETWIQKTHSIETWIQSIDAYYELARDPTFYREHILQRIHSIENTFYRDVDTEYRRILYEASDVSEYIVYQAQFFRILSILGLYILYYIYYIILGLVFQNTQYIRPTQYIRLKINSILGQ